MDKNIKKILDKINLNDSYYKYFENVFYKMNLQNHYHEIFQYKNYQIY